MTRRAVAVAVLLAGGAHGDEILWDNGEVTGIGGHSNATSGVFGFRRSLLDDFVVPDGEAWHVTGFEHLHVWGTPMGGAMGISMELAIWTDRDGDPRAIAHTAEVTSYTEMHTGRIFFSREEALSFTGLATVDLGPGRYWIEGAIVGPENNFWLTRSPVAGSEHWVSYDDLGGLQSSTDQFGVASDLNFRIFGTVACAADLDDTGAVGFADLLVLLSLWGPCDHPGGCPEDLDGNGFVEFGDLLILLGTWGPCGAACCLEGGDCSEVTFEDECTQMGGLFRGYGRTCVVSCAGACCFDDGTCFEDLEQGCAASGGIYHGDGTRCTTTCFGACCFVVEGMCDEGISESDCVAAGGDYRGDGSRCAHVCRTGACCFDDACIDVVGEGACQTIGGTYLGESTSCATHCLGACCLDGGCLLLRESACEAMGGTFRGAATECESDCPIDDCADALVVTEGSYGYTTVGATTDGAPLPPECDEGPGFFERDVWFRYFASCDGTATVSVCESSFNTRLAIYEDGDCPGPFLVCSDDACGLVDTRSEASFAVESGGFYIIRIGSRLGGTGSGTMVIECGP